MLLWFVSKSEINSALAGSLIEEEEVECRPEKISNAVLDENVDINLIRRFFTEDAWKVVEDVIESKKNSDTWPCKICYHDVHESGQQSIFCEGCLEWYHFKCVGITSQPKKNTGFVEVVFVKKIIEMISY